MSSPSREQALSEMRQAYRQNKVTLYLGAGISVGNGLPTWEKLVLSMYFSAIDQQPMGSWRPFPNYLFAIAEWYLERGHEPLEITARKIRSLYGDQREFMQNLRETLYAGFSDEFSQSLQRPDQYSLRNANPTLDAVAKICENSRLGENGVRSVITYNYDELLEIALSGYPFESIWRQAQKSDPDRSLPIYHVHGYVPVADEGGSGPQEIVFTEEDYHESARQAYSWANLVQIQSMTSSVGLMIGLSLSDQNMRRLLDSISKSPVYSENYALLQEPRWERPEESELLRINNRAEEYFGRFENSGMKRATEPGIKTDWAYEISGIMEQVDRLDFKQQQKVLEQLGIHPVWYKEHEEVPTLINQILEH